MRSALFSRKPLWLVFLAGLGLTLLNGLLHVINDWAGLPLFLDSVGTAAAAAAFGLIPGMVVAATTSMTMEAIRGFPGVYWPFVGCGVLTAVIVSEAVRRSRFSTAFDVVVVSILVTLANAICGATVATFLFGGITGATIDYVVTGFLASGRTLFSSTVWARVPSNLVDKTLSVIAAWGFRRLVVKAETR